MRRLLVRFLLVVSAVVVVLAAITTIRATQLAGRAQPVAVTTELAPVDVRGASERLAEAVRIPTISLAAEDFDREALATLHQLLAERFVLAHATLELEVVAEGSLLYRWPGTDRRLPPLVLMGHLDVVPIAARDAWTVPPFEGVIRDGFVWGRGTIDDKVNVLGALEAVEDLLARGFTPRRTVVLAFGHDEEVGGSGAQAMAARLDSEPFLVLDEGGMVLDNPIPGVSRSIAMIGVAEKGYVSLRLEAEGTGGHSSMPPRDSAVAVLARALVRLDEEPMPARYDGVTATFFNRIAPEMPFGQRLIFANLWLFRPLVIGSLSGSPETNAMLRTTIAPTMLEGSPKDNVLPPTASAVINFRIHPQDTSETVISHVERVIDDERVKVSPLGLLSEPGPIAPTEGEAWATLDAAVRAVYPRAAVTPSLVIAATDARHFRQLTDRVYNFTPVRIGPEDLSRFHGVDERISIETYGDSVRFYRALIEFAAGKAGS